MPLEHVPSHWEAYQRGAAKGGKVADRREWRVSLDIHVAETTEEARNDVLNHGMARTFNEYFFPLFRRMGMMDLLKSDDSMPDQDLTVEYLLENRWVVETRTTACKKSARSTTRGRIRHATPAQPGLGPPEKGWKSMELFAKHVAPQLRDLLPDGP